MKFKEIFEGSQETLGDLTRLSDNTWVVSRLHKDIDKGTITRHNGGEADGKNNFDIRTKQNVGKRFQFMIRFIEDENRIIIGARPTNGMGRTLELDSVKGSDLEKVAKKFKSIKTIEKFISKNVKKLN